MPNRKGIYDPTKWGKRSVAEKLVSGISVQVTITWRNGDKDTFVQKVKDANARDKLLQHYNIIQNSFNRAVGWRYRYSAVAL